MAPAPLPVDTDPDRRRAARRPTRSLHRAVQRVHILGEAMDLIRAEEVMQRIQHWVTGGEKRIIANHNLHSLYLIRRDPVMRTFYDRADLIELDSTPLIHFAQRLGLSIRPMHRCTYLDWRDHFWSLAARNGWRVSYVGGAKDVATVAAERLMSLYPGVVIQPISGYFDDAPGSGGNAVVVTSVTNFAPHVLLVGMGMPRQEGWIIANLDALPSCVILPVGAAFDYEAGVQKAAPRWMGRMGLEWLFRLVADPKRLFVRYCVEPWFLIGPALSDIVGAVRRRNHKPADDESARAG